MLGALHPKGLAPLIFCPYRQPATGFGISAQFILNARHPMGGVVNQFQRPFYPVDRLHQ
jgi:hypothetical protein